MLRSPEELLNDLITAEVVKPGDIYGCTDEEISAVESLCNVRLPESYKHFLKVMGKEKKGSRFYNDYLMFNIYSLDMVQVSQKEASKCLHYYFDYVLKPTEFVCLYTDATFQGWFDTAAGADPPLCLQTEVEEELLINAWPNFLSYVNFLVDIYVGRDDGKS